MKNRYLLACVATFLTLGCATPTPYKEAGTLGDGYRDFKIDDTKFRVSFRGNTLTERDVVEAYLIYRAAEITLEQGYTHFKMNNLATDRSTQVEPISPAVYGYIVPNMGSFPYYVYGHPNAPRSGTMERNQYEAVAYVTMFKGANSKNEQVFNAQEVIKNLSPRIQRPE